MLTVTVEEFRSWGLCWDDDRLDAFFAPYVDEPWSALDVLALRNVSAEDRLWVVLRKELILERTLRLFACDCAQKAMDDHGNGDARSFEAIRVARLRATGEATDSELGVAADAAWAATWAATWAAARVAADAANAAAWAAARVAADAANAAAWAAARAAARAVADAAATDAARAWQVRHLRALIQEGQ